MREGMRDDIWKENEFFNSRRTPAALRALILDSNDARQGWEINRTRKSLDSAKTNYAGIEVDTDAGASADEDARWIRYLQGKYDALLLEREGRRAKAGHDINEDHSYLGVDVPALDEGQLRHRLTEIEDGIKVCRNTPRPGQTKLKRLANLQRFRGQNYDKNNLYHKIFIPSTEEMQEKSLEEWQEMLSEERKALEKALASITKPTEEMEI